MGDDRRLMVHPRFRETKTINGFNNISLKKITPTEL